MISRSRWTKLYPIYYHSSRIKSKDPYPCCHLQIIGQCRRKSMVGKPLLEDQIDNLLLTPTWSVSSLIERQPDATPTENITQKQLHHLLRLSALPLPKTPQEEAKMIETLQSQLHFVRAIKDADTTGIKPLQAIRDETEEAKKASCYSMEDLKDEFDKEQSIGFARRIRQKAAVKVKQEEEEMIDGLKLAPNKIGRYVVVNTKNS